GPGRAALPAVVRVVIPEGETRLGIARIAAASGVSGSYPAASRRSPALNPLRYGAPRGTANLEGFLFPATYDLYRGTPASQLVAEQLLAFRERFGPELKRRARDLRLAPPRPVPAAARSGRGARAGRDGPLIAAVIYNRLRRGMPLGIDATIYYALALHSGPAAYTRELTDAQLHI